MTTTKGKTTVDATYVKDTAKGKKHFAIDSSEIAGAIYLTAAKHKAMGEPSVIKVTVEAA